MVRRCDLRKMLQQDRKREVKDPYQQAGTEDTGRELNWKEVGKRSLVI